MKIIAASFLAAAIGVAPSSPQPSDDDALTIRLSQDAAEKCMAEGGCGVVTRQWVEELKRQAFEAGRLACRKAREV